MRFGAVDVTTNRQYRPALGAFYAKMEEGNIYQLEDSSCPGVSDVLVGMPHLGEPLITRLDRGGICPVCYFKDRIVILGDGRGHRAIGESAVDGFRS